MSRRALYPIALISFVLSEFVSPAMAEVSAVDSCSGPYCQLELAMTDPVTLPAPLNITSTQPECANASKLAVLGLRVTAAGDANDVSVESQAVDGPKSNSTHGLTISCGELGNRQFATSFPFTIDLSTPEGQRKAESASRYLETSSSSELEAFLPDCRNLCASNHTDEGMCLAPDPLPPLPEETGECDLCELAEATPEAIGNDIDAGLETKADLISPVSPPADLMSAVKLDSQGLSRLLTPIIVPSEMFTAANPGVNPCAWAAQVAEELSSIGSEAVRWEYFTDRGGNQRIVAISIRRTSESTVETRITQAVLTRWQNGHLADDVVEQLTRQLRTSSTRTEYFAPTKAAAARCANPRNLPRLSRNGIAGWIRGVLALPPSAVFFAAIDISAYIGKEGIPMILGENIMKALQGNGDKLNRIAGLAYSPQGAPLLNDTCSACFARNAETFWTSGGPGLWLAAQDQGTKDVLIAYRTRVMNELQSCSCKEGGKVGRGGQYLQDFLTFKSNFSQSIQQGFMPFLPPGLPNNDTYVKLTDICMTTSD